MKVFSHCASRHTQSFCEHRDQLCKTTAIHIVIVCQFCGIVKASLGLHHDTSAEFALSMQLFCVLVLKKVYVLQGGIDM